MDKGNSEIRQQNGIVIGNVVDKSRVRNPISRHLVKNFDETLFTLIRSIDPESIHEVGCGEGRLTRMISDQFKVKIRATDLSVELTEKLRSEELPGVDVVNRNIYNLKPEEDRADLVICCEVLEHLERPHEALEVLKNLEARVYIFSVPREPIWRIVNLLRGSYWNRLGNTPGHIQHWTIKDFIGLIDGHGFRIQATRLPFPWIMTLCS
jgi:SAM-dependent methyltransferase